MDHEAEVKAIEEVQSRLAERFPLLDDEVIEAAVRLAHSELTGQIRDFVPVLVEHNARDRLAAFADQEVEPEEGEAAPGQVDAMASAPDPESDSGLRVDRS